MFVNLIIGSQDERDTEGVIFVFIVIIGVIIKTHEVIIRRQKQSVIKVESNKNTSGINILFITIT